MTLFRHRPLRWILAALLLLVTGTAIRGFVEARQMPLLRTRTIALATWPADAPPMRIVLMSDIHLGGLVSTPARLDRIVDRVNALAPDLVLMPGDFVNGIDPAEARAIAPALERSLGRLRARQGVFATLGNHDVLTGASAMTATLRRAGVIVLENDVAERGPLTIVGVGDALTQHAHLAIAWPKVRDLHRPILVMSHSALIAPQIPPAGALLLAGHSHCGQIRLPLLSRVAATWGLTMECGFRRAGTLDIIVNGGIGTSRVPLRFDAPPELWEIVLKTAAVR